MKRFLAIALVASIGLFAASTTSHAALYSTDDNTWDDGNAGGAGTNDKLTDITTLYQNGAMANGILDSRHNLGKFGEHILSNSAQSAGVEGNAYDVTVIGNMGTTEVCVFCHTPHHSNVTQTMAPLWNKGIQTINGFTGYNAGGANLTTAQTSTAMSVGSASLACLSCHDGVSTFDNIVNAPGKSTGGAGNALGGATGIDRAWAFYDIAGSVTNADYMTSARLNIGRNLSNDHPVSVVYTGGAAGKASLRDRATALGSIDLSVGLNGSAAAYDDGNITQNRWAVNGYITDTATIGDLLKTQTAGGSRDYVECTSCHDPHFKNQSWDEIESTGYEGVEVDGLFLRRVGGNTGSGVCRTCHAK